MQKDHSGEKFDRLTIVRFSHHKGPDYFWLCRCECGNEILSTMSRLRLGNTRSCGCLRKDELKGEKNRKFIHGMSSSRLVKVHRNMMTRCYNKNSKDYKDYGGRGIKICERWHDTTTWIKDVEQSYNEHIKIYGEKNTSFDRIDVNGDYTPENCRWATWKEQANNKRSNKKDEMKGVSYYGRR